MSDVHQCDNCGKFNATSGHSYCAECEDWLNWLEAEDAARNSPIKESTDDGVIVDVSKWWPHFSCNPRAVKPVPKDERKAGS